MAKKKQQPQKAPAKSSVKVLHSVYYNGKVILSGSVLSSAQAEGIPEKYLETV